ncbi:MAG: peptide chain release factor N(5)-glutamine methyltransferase [Myxococcota bacterium]|nr:peptide chain release factor N(5)-glutamine methyltransferase [Myxococcota bacterium]
MIDPHTVTSQRWLQTAEKALRAAGVGEAEEEAKALFFALSKVSHSQQILYPERPLERDTLMRLQRGLESRCARIPLSQICGYQDFWSASFLVSDAVLTPRPETERLVEASIKALLASLETQNLSSPPLVVDVGTGSGCVAISIGQELSAEGVEIELIAIDKSPAALEVARENSVRLDVPVTLLEGDLLAPLQGREARLIVSNPPYISPEEIQSLEPEVRDHEPRLALDGGAEGMMLIQRLVLEARRHLESGGWLLFEIGWRQEEAATDCLSRAGFQEISCLRDWAGHPRVMRGRQP